MVVSAGQTGDADNIYLVSSIPLVENKVPQHDD